MHELEQHAWALLARLDDRKRALRIQIICISRLLRERRSSLFRKRLVALADHIRDVRRPRPALRRLLLRSVRFPADLRAGWASLGIRARAIWIGPGLGWWFRTHHVHNLEGGRDRAVFETVKFYVQKPRQRLIVSHRARPLLLRQRTRRVAHLGRSPPPHTESRD